MKTIDFEELHRAETRRAEWLMLDQALHTRTAGRSWLRNYRASLGHVLIGIGTKLAGEQAVSDTCTLHPCP